MQHSPGVESDLRQPGLSCLERRRMKPISAQNHAGAREEEGFPVVRRNVAGMDVGSQIHWVCAPTVDGLGREEETFGATTPELERMAQWLKERKVESVAMESTGVYWIVPHEVLERHGLEVLLVSV